MSVNPSVSIVIRAKNEARLIHSTLQAIADQDYPVPAEVIVVDSGSTDGTVQIARGFGVRVLDIAQKDFTYGRALNLGIAASHGEIIVCLSAHSVPTTHGWLAALLAPFGDPMVGAVRGRMVDWPDATMADRLRSRVGIDHSDLPQDTDSFSNANSAMRGSLVRSAPFCEPIPSSEDGVWALTILNRGWRIRYAPDAAVYHGHYETFADFVYVMSRAALGRAIAASVCPL